MFTGESNNCLYEMERFNYHMHTEKLDLLMIEFRLRFNNKKAGTTFLHLFKAKGNIKTSLHLDYLTEFCGKINKP